MKIAAADIRSFVHRNRSSVQHAKRAHWGHTARSAPGVGVALSHALYAHARAVSPGFPSERSRDDDFAHHLRLKGLLDRAARSLSVRRGAR
jgi:hypothetical protein